MTLETHRSFTPELQSLVAAANVQLSASHAIERMWAYDYRLWQQDRTDITNRLGWLTINKYMKDRNVELQTFAASAKKRGIRDVVLLGMGGSSLGPEVLWASFGPSRGFPQLPKHVTTTPYQAAAKLKRHCLPGAYVDILAYTTPSAKIEQAIRFLRRALVLHQDVATTAGYGPRYLHSTGQLHKGAQATGDIQALQAHEQQAILLPLGKNPIVAIQALTKSLSPRKPVPRQTIRRKKNKHTHKK